MNRRIALLLLGTACTRPDEVLPERPAAGPSQEGVVTLPAASSGFIAVEAVTTGKGGVSLRVPARIAFKDGALSQLGAPIAGRVMSVQVRTGDRVVLGQSLVTLDCAEAAAMRTNLATSSAALKEAQAALEREKRMLDMGVGIERDRLAAETKVAELEADLQRAQAGFQFVGPGQGTTVVLRAPMAGIVISRRATAGAAVQPGSEPIVEIGDPGALWVVADVFERDLSLIHEGAAATVEVPSIRDPLAGVVASLGAVVANGMRTAPVRIELAAPAATLRPGMYGRASITAATSGLMVPTEAVLIRDGKDTVVYVEQGPHTYLRRPVVVGQASEGRVQVLGGLEAGERIVVKGALLLDGAAEQLL